MNLLEAKKIESESLKIVTKQFPHLFKTETFIDDQKFLGKYGILIPEKKKLPKGYLKLWPQDFIVEEITLDGEWTNIFPDKFMHKKRGYLPQDPVLFATLVKCGLSTIEAVAELAQKLKIDPQELENKIKFPGIKDKHAITSQLISIKLTNSKQKENEVKTKSLTNKDDDLIEKLHQHSCSHYYFIKNVFSGKKELFIGGLHANQFTILIRTCPDFKKEEFLKGLEEIQKNGFYNYYYLQRFGVPRLVAFYCGLHILKGDYEGAVKTAMCRTGNRESPYFSSLRKEVEKIWGDWDSISNILESFPLTFRNEIIMAEYLSENPNDFAGALNAVPKQTWLWVDAFGSLLWNNLLASYLKKGEKLPAALPVISYNEKSWSLYENFLKQAGLFSLSHVRKNLNPFPFILKRGGSQRPTIQKITLLNKTLLPQGVVLNFVLPKGSYATTFLSHLFVLVSGALPKNFSNLPIDTKANLKQQSLEEILNRFSDVVSTPSWRLLWRIY